MWGFFILSNAEDHSEGSIQIMFDPKVWMCLGQTLSTSYDPREFTFKK